VVDAVLARPGRASRGWARLHGLPLQLVAQCLLARGLLRREDLGREVRRLEHLPDLDLGILIFEGGRAALDPLDGLLLGPVVRL
jgi:hypothetical protein